MPASTKEWVVRNSVGYCGADIKALCAEACLVCLRRTFPQVYESSKRMVLDADKLSLGRGDFAAALQRVVPASRRSNTVPGCPLESMSADLLQSFLDEIVEKLQHVFPPCMLKNGGSIMSRKIDEPNTENMVNSDSKSLTAKQSLVKDNDLWISCLTDVQDLETMKNLLNDDDLCSSIPTLASNNMSLWDNSSVIFRPRLLIFGDSAGMGQSELANATLHRLEEFPIFSLDFSSLLADGRYVSPENALVSRIIEASKVAPSVLYLPDVTSWWRSATDSMRSALIAAAAGMDRTLPVLWLSTAATGENQCDDETRLLWLLNWLSGASPKASMTLSADHGSVKMSHPSDESREKLFTDFFVQVTSLPVTIYAAKKKMLLSKNIDLTIAASPEANHTTKSSPDSVAGVHCNDDSRNSGQLSLTELLADPPNPYESHDMSYIDIEEAKNYMRELRLFMRAALTEMFKEKKLSVLCRPVDPEQVPDYYDVITAPMDLDTMRSKVDENMYPTYRCFYYDLEQIGFNAAAYNPLDSKDVKGRQIVHAARSLLDMVETHAYNFKSRLGYDLFKRCDMIASSPAILKSVLMYDGIIDTAIFARAVDSRVKNKADMKRIRAIIPRENEVLYREILARHMQLKAEMGDEHPSYGPSEPKLVALAQDINDFRNGRPDKKSGSKAPKRFSLKADDDSSLRRSSRGRGDDNLVMLTLDDLESANRKKRRSVDTTNAANSAHSVEVSEVDEAAAIDNSTIDNDGNFDDECVVGDKLNESDSANLVCIEGIWVQY